MAPLNLSHFGELTAAVYASNSYISSYTLIDRPKKLEKRMKNVLKRDKNVHNPSI